MISITGMRSLVKAETGKKGMALFQLHRPQLVVLNSQLPDVWRAALRRTPVVMISGRFTEYQDKVQGLELGADEFFTKPFDPVLFVARVKNLLRSSAHLQTLSA